ncbi:HWE histidine kinase domain-containing protein [Opacimonas viscosa]|uniref:histidine kinase n=1 Tax=Opacimonas viscosa TaxID=2961944 RepID=A0AA42BLU6_9ALTE|nr:HWE histidine kinase domain-containing protein [Opacimonas viscosa]MCP3429160.1 GAF domain-containing protein [Opacimonas viscosa]
MDNAQVDLTNCDREPIHLLGNIQNYGALLAFGYDWQCQHASANLDKFLSQPVSKILGSQAASLFSHESFNEIKETLTRLDKPDQTERIFGIELFGDEVLYDVSMHLSNMIIVIEFEYHQALVHHNSLSNMRTALRNLSRTYSLESFFVEATETVAKLTGFGRIMLYRFHNDGSGEVIAETIKSSMDSFYGLRYPASDIPKQARKLYLRNLTRQIENVNSDVVPILSNPTMSENQLDLSMSSLRAVSPIHIEYLTNMGVNASFSLSVIVNGELWGLFACHDNKSNYVSLEMRSIIEVFGEVFSLELTSKLRNSSYVDTDVAQNLHLKMMAALDSEQSVFSNLSPYIKDFYKLIPCETVLLWVDGKMTTHGASIAQEDIHLLIACINSISPNDIICTDNLRKFLKEEVTVGERFGGMLAIPISRSPRDFLIFLRKEEHISVKWAGNPEKPVTYGPNGSRLTPRKSFAAWQEVRKGYSKPWLEKEIGLARLIKQMLLEIIIRNIDERQRLALESQQQQDMLIHELNHRVRNILGLINSVVSKTAKGSKSVAEFKTILGGRIDSISVAQNHLTEKNWSHAPLQKLITTEIQAYTDENSSRVTMDGENIDLLPKAYTTLTLVIHELVTNAVKYGGLNAPGGKVNISWTISDSQDLVISWKESGFACKTPTKKGFGSVIIGRSIPFDLNGESTVEFGIDGLHVLLKVPQKYIYKRTETTNPKVQLIKTPKNSIPISLLKEVLILEDNMIIALDIEETMQDLSAKNINICSNSISASDILDQKSVSFAVLDINLGGSTSIEIAKKCQTKGIPIIFITGYKNLDTLLDIDLSDIPVLSKPMKKTDLVNALANLVSH